MGLDTVELVMEFEKYFGIRIPDSEAEKIYTLDDTVTCIARHRNIHTTTTLLREEITIRLSALLTIPGQQALQPEYLISNFIQPDNTTRWQQLETQLQLHIPVPANMLHIHRNRISKWFTGQPGYSWKHMTCGHFIDTLCACNYKQLIDRNHIRDHYDLYIAIAGITIVLTGIDPYEVEGSKSFTDDLGMD